jgi:hypothetical protein
MAAKDDKKKKPAAKGKANAADKKGKKGKKGKGAADGEEQTVFSVASHPKAKATIRRAKGWGGLIGFALAFYLSLKASVPVVDAGGRALVAGLVGYMLGWACSVTIWRQVMVAELRHAAEEVRARRAAAEAAAPTVGQE